MRVPLGYSRLELRWGLDYSNCEPLHVFSDRSSALQFLLWFQSDPDVMLSLRRLLAEKDMQYAGKDFGDLKILEEIANRLESQELRLTSWPTSGIPDGVAAARVEPQPEPP